MGVKYTEAVVRIISLVFFQNVKTVFDAAIKVALRPPKPKKKPRKKRTCTFL